MKKERKETTGKKLFTVELTKEEHKELKVWAAERGVTMSDLVREFLHSKHLLPQKEGME